MKNILITLMLLSCVGCSHVHTKVFNEKCFEECVHVDKDGITHGIFQCTAECNKETQTDWWWEK